MFPYGAGLKVGMRCTSCESVGPPPHTICENGGVDIRHRSLEVVKPVRKEVCHHFFQWFLTTTFKKWLVVGDKWFKEQCRPPFVTGFLKRCFTGL